MSRDEIRVILKFAFCTVGFLEISRQSRFRPLSAFSYCTNGLVVYDAFIKQASWI